MAGFSHHRSGSRTSVNDNGGAEHDLPTGSCEFRDLALGVRAPTCGCKRFWMNSSHFHTQDWTSIAFCFCGHHACYHNEVGQQSRSLENPSDGVANSAGVQNLSEGTVQHHDEAQQALSPSRPAGLGIRQSSHEQSQSINTRVWEALNRFARDQEDGIVSDTASKLPSTAVPSVAGDKFSSSPMHFPQAELRQYRPMGPPVNIPTGYVIPGQAGEDYSATEVATPSIAGTPDLRAFAAPGTEARVSPSGRTLVNIPQASVQQPEIRQTIETNQRSEPAIIPPRLQRRLQASTASAMSVREIQDSLEAYGQRLDVLETLSFSHVPAEEINDKFDLVDGRLLDLEQWRTDLSRHEASPESAQPSNKRRRCLLPTETSSLATDGSFDSNAAMHTEAAVLATLAANAETGPRIDGLESRVSELESTALPSFARPWHLQVVLLPWGRELRGIWYSSAEATQHSLKSNTQASEEWSGTQTAPKLSFRSTDSITWTTESIQAWANETRDWLSPKACGPSGTVFQRLFSRGLVRNITITAPDAGHVFNKISSGFAHYPRVSTDLEIEQTKRFQGLAENFIPLRKMRKSSRLRFLSPSEMVTSALWTAGFLNSSVFMRVNDGQRRLYVTTSDSYLQPLGQSCSWQSLRQLPLFDAGSDEHPFPASNTAVETCWTYHDKFDQHPSAHPSFTSNETSWSVHEHDDNEDPVNGDQPLSPRSERRPSRQRTASLPSSNAAAEKAKDALPKRRVASFETAGVRLVQTQHEAQGAAKRRRISESPEAERKGVALTPSWSREPPSPFTSDNTAEAQSQIATSKKRGTTPSAYATPHSNNLSVGRVDLISGDGDTEADTDVVVPPSHSGEDDEWRGVEEALRTPSWAK